MKCEELREATRSIFKINGVCAMTPASSRYSNSRDETTSDRFETLVETKVQSKVARTIN